MSISSRITSMEEHIGNAYQGLQNIGVDITGVNKNIENISSMLEEAYKEAPKVSDTGTDITLDNTRKGRVDMGFSGNTSQYTTTGKNLFNIEGRYETGTGITYTKNDDGSYTLNGTANGNNFLRGVYHLNEQHTLSYTSNVSNSNVILRTRTGTPSAQTGIQDQLAVSSTSGNLTSSKQFDFVEISIVSGTTLNNFKIYIQLEKGSSVTSFEPYTGGIASPNPDYPQDIHVVSGDNKINVVGKNLLPISTLATQTKNGITFTNNNNGSYTFNGTATAYTTFDLNNDLSFNGNYTYVMRDTATSGFVMYLQSSSGQGIGQATTHTTIDNSIGRMIIGINNGVSLNNVTIKPYVYKGAYDSTIEYEPYQGNTYPINLGVKNLWNSEDMKSGYLPQSGSYPTTETSYPNSRYIIVHLMKGQSITTYSEVTYNAFRIRYIDKDTNLIVGTVSVGENNGYCSSDATYQSGFANGTITATKDVLLGLWDFDGYMSTSGYYKITYGTTLQQISPNPIELAEISTYNDEIFRTSGKNLFDKSTVTTSAYLKEDGTLQTGTGAEYITSDFIPVTPNTTYYKTLTLSPRTKFYNKNKQVLDNSTYQDVSIGGNAGSFTTPNNAYYFRFTGNVNTSTGIDINLTMVNEGSSAIDYEPYGTGEWYWKKRIEKANLKDKSISLQSINSYNIANFLVQPIELNVPDTSLYNYSLCNRFSVQTTSIANTQTEGFLRTLNGEIHSLGVYIRIKSERANTVETFKTWLENNTTYYSWVLFKPAYTKITSSNYPTLYSQLEAIYNAQGYDNQTNISQTNNDLPFKITASALKKWSE